MSALSRLARTMSVYAHVRTATVHTMSALHDCSCLVSALPTIRTIMSVFPTSRPCPHHSPLCFHERGTSLRAIIHNSINVRNQSLNQLCFTKRHVPPCYQSQLIMLCFHERHVPPCYQSQLIIMLWFHERHVPPCYQSQLIIVVFTRSTSSVLSITTHHHVVHKGHVPPCYQSQLIIMLCFHERGTSLRAINHNSSSRCVFNERVTSSVLSITTHHHVVVPRHVLRAINHNSSSR
jgi:hypothetical protein